MSRPCGTRPRKRACCRNEHKGGTSIDQPSPGVDPGHALFELAPRLTRLENTVLRAVDPPLTFRQYRLLERIAGGYTTVTALGRVATITLPAISESVDVLVRKDLLARRANQQDRRESHLSLTASGWSALDQATELLQQTAEQILAGVPARRRSTLAKDISRVTDEVTAALLAAQASERDSDA
jgi:DNA-binding MarR family transcriptional regulator